MEGALLRRALLGALTAVSLLGLAACGGGDPTVSHSEAVAVDAAKFAQDHHVTVYEATSVRTIVVRPSASKPAVVFEMACTGGSVIPVYVDGRERFTVDCSSDNAGTLQFGGAWKPLHPGFVTVTVRPRGGQKAWFVAQAGDPVSPDR